jgi:hypothetical protein
VAITFVNAGAKSTSELGTLTLGAPASPQTDDVWIAVIAHSVDFDDYPDTFTDWNLLSQSVVSGDMYMGVYYFRYAGSTPNLNVVWVAPITPSSIGGIASFRGVKTSGSPANAVGTQTTTGTASATIAHAAIVPSVESCLLVINAAIDDNNRTALGGDYALAFDDGGGVNCYAANLGNDMSIAMSYDLSVPASTTGTINQTQGGSDDYSSVLIALEPAGGAAAGQPYDLHEGGIPYVNPFHGGQGWRFWRELLVPRKRGLIYG